MPNDYFQFKQFRIDQAASGMKVTTEGCLFGGWVAQMLGRKREPQTMLDIGAGTGLLSLMVAQQTQETLIDAVEINPQAFEEANHNFQQSPWKDRLTGFLNPVQNLVQKKYDIIITNPPFFKDHSTGQSSSKNQAIHSDYLSQDDLLEQMLRFLSPTGTCYVLYPAREMETFTHLARSRSLYPTQQVIVKHQSTHPTFRIMQAFQFKSADLVTSELIIKEVNGKYTSDSWNLLQDYLLEYNSPKTY